MSQAHPIHQKYTIYIRNARNNHTHAYTTAKHATVAQQEVDRLNQTFQFNGDYPDIEAFYKAT